MARKNTASKTDAKPAKPKLVRDSFTMPKDDYALIDALKAKAVDAKRPAKKSELLRAGLRALEALSVPDLKRALDALAPVKTGRPKGAPVVASAVMPVAAPAPARQAAVKKTPARKTPKAAAKKAVSRKAPAKTVKGPVTSPVKAPRRRAA